MPLRRGGFEPAGDGAPARVGETPRIVGVLEHAPECGGAGLRTRRRDEQTGDVVDDDLGRAVHSSRHDGETALHRLHHGARQPFVQAGHDEDVEAREQRWDVVAFTRQVETCAKPELSTPRCHLGR